MTSTAHHHDHSAEADDRRSFVTPDHSQQSLLSRHEDGALLNEVYDAALDGCSPCQERLIDRVAHSVDATFTLVHWSCQIATDVYGESPDVTLNEQDTSAGLVSAPFRQLGRSYGEEYMEGTSEHGAMLRLCSTMSFEQRRQAAATAVTLVVGLGDFGEEFPFS